MGFAREATLARPSAPSQSKTPVGTESLRVRLNYAAERLPPLRELGADPVSSKPVVLKEGRFGPYVTDGETNASLRRGDEPETVTIERAAELLADRRSRGPAPKKKRGGGRRSAA